MTRITILKREDMTAEQGEVYDEAKAKGGPVGGPHYAYIRYPRLMRAFQDVGFALGQGGLSKRERQVAIMAVCRFWGAEYPWAVQARNALKIGLEAEIIDAINAGQAPAIADAREKMAYDLASELLDQRKLSDATYAKAASLFDEKELLCLIATVGQYSVTCLTTSAYDVTPPADVPHRLEH